MIDLYPLKPNCLSIIMFSFRVFANVPYGEFWLKLLSTVHLNSIHLGTDKNFQILYHNKKSSLIEFNVKLGEKETDTDDKQKKIDFEMIHKTDTHTKVIDHKWAFTLNYMKIYDKLSFVFQRKDYTNSNKTTVPIDFRVCINTSHSPLTFMQTPEIYEFDIVFGFDSPLSGCPTDMTKIYIKTEKDVRNATIVCG